MYAYNGSSKLLSAISRAHTSARGIAIFHTVNHYC